MNDASYPWFILAPRRADIREIFELEHRDQQQLLVESSQLSRVLHKIFQADKLNIAALGNLVPQLHVHHVVRYYKDPAWPRPVWGVFPAQAYTERARQETCSVLIEHLSDFVSGDNCAVIPRVC
jgi:diadenosine tetraphosphate (Ap4A) HIT family hydrolase